MTLPFHVEQRVELYQGPYKFTGVVDALAPICYKAVGTKVYITLCVSKILDYDSDSPPDN